MSSGVCTEQVRSKYGASTEQVRSKRLLGIVSKMVKIEIKRKNNCDYGYKKHTKDFSNRFFNEHPHKYNLLGLSKMLSDFYRYFYC